MALPFNVGAGRGGSMGDEPPSAVELVDKAGDPGCSPNCEGGFGGPSSALAAGGGVDGNEDVV